MRDAKDVILAIVYLAMFGVASVVCGQFVHHELSCHNILLPDGTVAAQTRIGPSLAIPVVQACARSTGIAFGYTLPMAFASAIWLILIRRSAAPWILAFCYVIAAILCVLFPFISTTDAYAYSLYGYEAAILHTSPYTAHTIASSLHFPLALRQLFPGNSSLLSANYGPAAVAFYELIAKIANGNITSTVLLLRVSGAVAVLMLAVIIAAIAPPTRRRNAFAFIALQPLLLMECIAFAHTDCVMLLFAALAFGALLLRQDVLAGIFLVAASCVRSVALLGLAVLLMNFIRVKEFRRAGTVVASSAIAFVGFAVIALGHYSGLSLGTAPGVNPYSSPTGILALLTANYPEHLRYFAAPQCLFALIWMAYLILRAEYELVVIAMLAALPTLHPWYLCWAAPVAAASRNDAVRYCVATMLLIGIFGEWTLISTANAIVVGSIYVLLQWLAPVASYLFFKKKLHLTRGPVVAVLSRRYL